MALLAGERLGPYEIRALLGAGGMGEVYRARDTKLGRDVAIKVLPEEFSQDNKRLARFKREAQLLAALNHPNIAAIHGLEQSGATLYLVLELVPGETLAARLSRGRLAVGEVLEIAAQIAEALEEAHEKGIIHRDLKPGNITLTEDGKIKVLDFGLARAFAEDTPEADTSLSPTLTRDGTRAGVILGTAAYMSPEQARGRKLDKRSDIFSFGAVLYEMLSGKKAFAGEDVSDILASVIKLEPDWAALPDALDPRIESLLRRCVEKDRKKRRRDIGDVRNEIEEALATPERGRAALPERSGGGRLSWVAGIAGLLAGIAATALLLSPSAEPLVTRFVISTDGLTVLGRHVFAVSHDGRTIAYSKNGQLNLRNMDRLETTALPGTDGARSPAFSPNDQWIAFWSDGLKKAPVGGGTPVSLSAASNPLGVSWVGDAIYFAEARGILRVSANGGEPEVVVEPEENEQLSFPRLLPDGRTLLFTLTRSGQSNRLIMSHSLVTGARRVLVDGGSDARYLPTGHLVYRVGATLQAVPFDLDALEVAGGATTVVEGVAPVVGSTDSAGAHFAVSESGSLVYLAGGIADNRLVWVSRQGVSEPLSAPPAAYAGARISPDEARLAIQLESDIWLYDIARGAMSRLTFTSDNLYPVWTPDGEKIVFGSRRNGAYQLFWQPADGSGEAEQITTGELDRHPDAISPDGTVLVFHEHHADNNTDLWVLEMEGDREPRPFLRNEFHERIANVSPDGRWLSYTSNESGQNEVYVRPFPDGGAKILVSTGGGGNAVWSRDGRELFYRNSDQLMAVPIDSGDELTVGAPTFLFESSFSVPNPVPNIFDVTADGERFLVVESNIRARGELQVVLNWFEELERLVPTN